MLRRSLTAKILVAVGVTVALVITIYTYFVIRVQSAWWHERTRAQTFINATMIHEYLNGVMLSERHLEVQGFLQELHQSGEIWRGRVVRPDGLVVFSTSTQEIARTRLELPAELFTENKVLQGSRREAGEPLTMVLRPVPNNEGCQTCHDPRQPLVGAIAVERSLRPAQAAIANNRNLLIVYGLVIFVLVGSVLWLLIIRLVTQPVSDVLERMRQVQAGDLRVRASVDSGDEIGELADGFNTMVQSLDRTTRELHESHEKQIQQAAKLASIGELASGIAHEIRNPLAGIGAAVEVLSETGPRQGQEGEIVAEIHRQIRRLNTTLHNLLDFARQREPERTPCPVTEPIRSTLNLVRPDAQKQHVEIIEQYATDLPPILADGGQLEQALLNIFLNAIQAMPNGGILTVAAELRPARPAGSGGPPADPGTVSIRIQDTGCGIPRENLGKIFSPFFTTKHRGTGLGLAISRSIVEKHRGSIQVTSEPNRGTTFVIEFAACPEEMMAEKAPAAVVPS